VDFPALDRLERLTGDLERLQRTMESRIQELIDEPFEADGADGLIHVTVDHAGRVTGVRLDPRAMRMGSELLADELVRTIHLGQTGATERFQAAMREVTGVEPPSDEALPR
jgi:DNA-binding protein YbaB